jgi:hypothetical protein
MRALVLLMLLGGVAHAADPKCFSTPERWSYDRDKGESLSLAGERFLDDMQKCDSAFAASVFEVARYQLQSEEAKKFVRQIGFVEWAYGVAWALLVVSGLLLWLRQRRLNRDIAELEARLRAAEAKP